ncbi:MAG TPA: hypothetical protein VIU86_19830 [Gaiellaceae bacterium]
MGSGSFDANSYRSYTSSVANKTRDEIYTGRSINHDLDPKNVSLRESRDSADNPRSTPIIIALDVTGSMGLIAENIARGGLGALFQGILDRKPVTDPHLMFMGIGDAACDRAPLQVSQFEADNRIVDQLTKLWLEAGGGWNNHESYDLAWYFAARHTAHDSMAKRGKRGYLFTVGDEETPEGLSTAELQKYLGGAQRESVTSAASLAEAQRLYDVFHIVIEEGDYARRAPDRVRSTWRAMLGQRVIHLADHKLLAETVVSAIQVAEGADHSKAVAGWGAHAESIIGKAVQNLPRGVPAPRQLGV